MGTYGGVGAIGRPGLGLLHWTEGRGQRQRHFLLSCVAILATLF